MTLPALTGLRGVAALMVMLYHFAGPGCATHNYLYLNWAIEHGYLGVDVFFVLSGYILTYVHYRRPLPFKRFLQYRFARLYPVHLLTLALSYGLFIVAIMVFHKVPADVASYAPMSLLANLTMTHAWLPGVAAPNIPAWSISAEWAAYLCFPLIRRLLHGSRWHKIGVALCCVMIIIAIDGGERTVAPYPVLRVMPEFTLGVVLYKLHVRCWHLSLGWWPLVYLGDISYSIYMLHSPVWALLKNVARVVVPGLDMTEPAVVGVGIVIVIGCADVVYRVIEVPGRTWLRQANLPVISLRRLTWRSS